MKTWFAYSLIGGLCCSFSATAGERVFGAEPNDSHWEVVSSMHQCRLEHVIPQFGRVVFSQPVDAPLRFELQSLRPQQTGEVALRAIPPEWRPGFPIVELGSIRYTQSQQPLRVQDERAEWLLAELEEGIYPAIFYPESSAGRGGVSVVVSGVRFRGAFDRFLSCRSELLNVDIAALRAKTLHFATNKSALNKGDRRALTELAEYVKSGGPDRKVVIEAHADARGGTQYNKRLSQRRARAVQEFLLSQGLGQRQIRMSSYGEGKPIANNRTETGRAQNRRALVRVVN